MLVGEVGISRHEFYYELRWWEIKAIIRGYHKRDRSTHRMLAELIFATAHMMRDPNGKKVEDFFPSLFSDDDDEGGNRSEIMTDSERRQLQEDIDSFHF